MQFNYSEHSRWMQDRGDETHRLNYPLNSNSIVLDAGGYHGEWAQKINEKYGSEVYVLEPISSYYNGLLEKFKDNESIRVFNFGLSSAPGRFSINLDNASSSLYKPGTGKEEIEISTLDLFMMKEGIEEIDLFKINIEGSEFDLLEDIINKGIQTKIKNIQVQFHVFVQNCESRRDWIREELSKTHECVYNYEYIWEGWKIKE